jgi:hypothetical protein
MESGSECTAIYFGDGIGCDAEAFLTLAAGQPVRRLDGSVLSPHIYEDGLIEIADAPGFEAVFHLARPVVVPEDGLQIQAAFYAIGGGVPQITFL